MLTSACGPAALSGIRRLRNVVSGFSRTVCPDPPQCVSPKRVILFQYYARMQKSCGPARSRLGDRYEAAVRAQQAHTAGFREVRGTRHVRGADETAARRER